MADIHRSRFVGGSESEREFENLLRRSPGAKLFFNLPPRRLEADTPSVSSQSGTQSKSCRSGLLSPISQILKQMRRPPSTESADKGNIALNNGYTSPRMPPPKTTFVYRRKGDTPDEVTLSRLHVTPIQLSDTPTRSSEDDLDGREEEMEEDEEEDDNMTEQEEVYEHQQLHDDAHKSERVNEKKRGRDKTRRPAILIEEEEDKALNNGYTSPRMPPPKTTFVYQRKGDTPDEVTLSRLHVTPIQLSDTPTRSSEDDLDVREEEMEEDEEEEDNMTEQEEVYEHQQLHDDAHKSERVSEKKRGRDKTRRPVTLIEEEEDRTSEDTNGDAFREDKSERTAGICQKEQEKNYRDTPPNVDMNDVIEETVMDQWYLTQPRKRILVIEGHRVGDPEDELWHSSAISKRLSPKLLVTASGSRYRLQGPISIEMTLENGFSAELVKKFLKGFPADWKEIIQEQCLKSEELDSQEPKHSTSQKERGTSHKKGSKQNTAAKSTPVAAGNKNSKDRTTQGKPKSQPESKTTPSNTANQTSSAAFKTPKNAAPLLVAVNDLHRSRSGRRILPPLAYWTGERIRPNYRLDKVEIIGGGQDYTSSFSNTPKLVGLEPDKKNVKTKSNIYLRPRQRKQSEKRCRSSESELHKTKGGSVAKQPKRKKERTRSAREKIAAEDEKAKSKVRDRAEKTDSSMQSKKKGNSKMFDDKVRKQTEKEKNEKQEGDEEDRGKDEDETEDDEEEAEALYWSRKSTRRQLRRDRTPDAKEDEGETEDDEEEEAEVLYWSRKSTRRQLRRDTIPDATDGGKKNHDNKEKNSQERMDRRVTRSRASKRNVNKRVDEDAGSENDVLEKEYGSRKGEKNESKEQKMVSQSLRDAGPLPEENVHSSEQPQTSDTESAKQEREMQRIAKQDVNKKGNGSTSFDLYGDILGVLNKQRQERLVRRSQDMRSSSRYQRTSSEASSADESDGEHNEIVERNKMKGDVTSDCRKERSGIKATSKTWSMVKKKRTTSGHEKSLVGSFQKSPEAWSSQDRVQPVRVCVQLHEEKEEDGATNKNTRDRTKDEMENNGTNKRTRRNRKSKTALEKENGANEDAWTQDEKERLQMAIRNTKPSTNNFWEKISEAVGTRDEEECRIQHQSSVGTEKAKTGQDRKSSKVAPKATVTINAKKGTLKRKRQLRELAVHHNMGFEEDLFDATPYRKEKKSRILLCDSSDEENSEAPVSSKTPSLAMPAVVPFSTKKTPHANWTPGLLQSVNRNKAEEYIFRMQKRKNLSKQKSTPLATRPVAKTGTKKTKFQNRFNDKEVQEAFDVKEITEDEDSEEEKDYYWSEEEDAAAT